MGPGTGYAPIILLPCLLTAAIPASTLPIASRGHLTHTNGLFHAPETSRPRPTVNGTAPRGLTSFLYISFHGGRDKKSVNQVLRYGFDGKAHGSVLADPPKDQPLYELRFIRLPPRLLLQSVIECLSRSSLDVVTIRVAWIW